MTIADVRQLPLREKFQILEVIWDDLSAHMEEMAVSPAVRELLDNRLERIANGSVEVRDWDSVIFRNQKPSTRERFPILLAGLHSLCVAKK